MAMIANDPSAAKRVGVPQSVGQDFVEADKGHKFRGKSKSDTPGDHIARRKESSGQTYAAVAKEFGVSKSTAHRRAKKAAGDHIRNGFNRLGSAK